MKKYITLTMMLIAGLMASNNCLAGGFNVTAEGGLLHLARLEITLQDTTSLTISPIVSQHGDLTITTYITVDGPVESIEIPRIGIVSQALIDEINQKLDNDSSEAATIDLDNTNHFN